MDRIFPAIVFSFPFLGFGAACIVIDIIKKGTWRRP